MNIDNLTPGQIKQIQASLGNTTTQPRVVATVVVLAVIMEAARARMLALFALKQNCHLGDSFIFARYGKYLRKIYQY